MNTAEKFGQNLKKIREAFLLTQEEFGRKCDMSGAHISHFETGSREPSLANVIKICKGAGCDVTALLYGIV